MNWLDFNFWFFGPTSIWFLGCVILFLAITFWITSRRLTTELKRAVPEVKQATSELRKDTGELRTSTSKLDEGLELTRESINKFHKTIQSIYSFWFPLAGDIK